MSPRLKSIVAVWFVMQIVLPFTAPLQTSDLRDLLGAKDHRSAPVSPESSTTPTTVRTANANLGVSSIAPSALRTPAGLIFAGDLTSAVAFVAISTISPAPRVQRSILRL
jgi:hypothetical protein